MVEGCGERPHGSGRTGVGRRVMACDGAWRIVASLASALTGRGGGGQFGALRGGFWGECMLQGRGAVLDGILVKL